eukprot:TRINITY_DN4765_c0_g1_i1.p1 TRINITY_DN4765_c0_g1~~TRINITY_DN4765_c0_g1_i1.p1  ORF type:complete len:290 (+),score=78.52 TRINITY_DN4765_c0_g1_i1:238-1107(+)
MMTKRLSGIFSSKKVKGKDARGDSSTDLSPEKHKSDKRKTTALGETTSSNEQETIPAQRSLSLSADYQGANTHGASKRIRELEAKVKTLQNDLNESEKKVVEEAKRAKDLQDCLKRTEMCLNNVLHLEISEDVRQFITRFIKSGKRTFSVKDLPKGEANPFMRTAPKQRVVALYDFEGDSKEDLAFEEGDIITVTTKRNDGWWDGTANGLSGKFPSNFVEIFENDFWPVEAQKSWEGKEKNDLSFKQGEILVVLRKLDYDGWFLAENLAGKTGYVPEELVEPVEVIMDQ